MSAGLLAPVDLTASSTAAAICSGAQAGGLVGRQHVDLEAFGAGQVEALGGFVLGDGVPALLEHLVHHGEQRPRRPARCAHPLPAA
jgi:hypothetical protein